MIWLDLAEGDMPTEEDDGFMADMIALGICDD